MYEASQARWARSSIHALIHNINSVKSHFVNHHLQFNAAKMEAAKSALGYVLGSLEGHIKHMEGVQRGEEKDTEEKGSTKIEAGHQCRCTNHWENGIEGWCPTPDAGIGRG